MFSPSTLNWPIWENITSITFVSSSRVNVVGMTSEMQSQNGTKEMLKAKQQQNNDTKTKTLYISI